MLATPPSQESTAVPPYASPRQRPATSATSPSVPFRPSQLRSPVPPTRSGGTAPSRPRHGLGRPSSWAVAVAALLVGLLLGLVWAGVGVTASEVSELLVSVVSALRNPG